MDTTTPLSDELPPTESALQGNPLTSIWDGMNEFELMRGGLEDVVTRLGGAVATTNHTDPDDVIDVAIMTIRLSEIVEAKQREVDATLDTVREILSVQADTNTLITSALSNVRDQLLELVERLDLVEDQLDDEHNADASLWEDEEDA